MVYQKLQEILLLNSIPIWENPEMNKELQQLMLLSVIFLWKWWRCHSKFIGRRGARTAQEDLLHLDLLLGILSASLCVAGIIRMSLYLWFGFTFRMLSVRLQKDFQGKAQPNPPNDCLMIAAVFQGWLMAAFQRPLHPKALQTLS